MAMDEKTTLRENGLKVTPARVAVLHYLYSLDEPISAEDLFRAVAKSGIDLSTLYRTLNAFVEAGIAKKEVGRRKENLYRLTDSEVEHLMVCLRCGKKVPLSGCPYHEVNERLERETGFHVLDHNTEIYGICPECQKAR